MSAKTKKKTRRRNLWDVLSAGHSTELEQFAPTIVLFKVKPLSTNRLRWLLHRLRFVDY